jgi:preprotein translocase subunit SecG
MSPLESALLMVHLLVAVAICGFVLLQHGKGADMGAAFGSGSAGSLFGSAGAANFLSRTTGILAAVFFATSLGLTYYHSAPGSAGGVTQQLDVPAAKSESKPAVPAPSAPAPSGAPAGGSPQIPK